MSALAYLVAMGAKNALKEAFTNPVRLVLIIAAAALVAFVAAISASSPAILADGPIDMSWLRLIFFAFVLMFSAFAVKQGLTSGGSIFDMSDVNLLFAAPVKPGKILVYGLVRMMKVAFISSLFVLFQSATLSRFGLGFGGLLALFLAFIMAMFILSMLSVAIYSFTNGDRRRKAAAAAVSAACLLPSLLRCGALLAGGSSPAEALLVLADSPLLSFVPVAGWTTGAAFALLTGDALGCLGYAALSAAFVALLAAYVALSRSDYYEDVICAAESAFERRRAIADGNISAAYAGARNVRVAKTGLGGFGAPAMFHKHLRESFRERLFGFLDLTLLIYLAAAMLMAAFMRDSADYVMILNVIMWMQMIMIGRGMGLKELYMHYIYMIPETSFSKIVWSNIETLAKSAIEGTVALGAAGIALRESAANIACAAAAFALFSFLLVAINYFLLRWTGGGHRAMFIFVIYMLLVSVSMLPGVVAAAVIAAQAGGRAGTAFGLLALAAWELLAALLYFMSSRGLLHNCDMPSFSLYNKR
jgi:hypothetical protein